MKEMYKSASLNSLNLQPTSATSVLTLTANPDVKPSSFSKITRRMAIIPTPNRLARLVTSARNQPSINENASVMSTILSTDKSIHLNNNNKSSLHRKQNSSEMLDVVDNQSNHDDHNKNSEDDDNLFDAFIC